MKKIKAQFLKSKEPLLMILHFLFIAALLVSISSLLGDRTSLERDIEELQKTNSLVLDKNAELQDQVWNLSSSLESLTAEVEEHRIAGDKKDAKIAELDKQGKASAKERDKLQKQIEELNSLNESLKKKLKEVEADNANLQKKVSAKKAENVKVITASTKTKEPTKAPSVSRGETKESKPSGKSFYVSATAYTAFCNGCSGVTRTGIDLRANPSLKVIAVDPKVIPLGSKVHVEGYGNAIAGDTGGAIKGNKIDLFIADKSSAIAWGRKQVKITILE